MKNKSELECVNVKKLLYGYIDNELTQIQLSAVKEHIKECEVCKNNYNNMIKVKNMIKQAYEPKENIDFSEIRVNGASCDFEARVAAEAGTL